MVTRIAASSRPSRPRPPRSGGRREAIEHMLRQEFGGGVDALEFRDLVEVSIAERFQDRLQRLVRSTDIDDDSVRSRGDRQ